MLIVFNMMQSASWLDRIALSPLSKLHLTPLVIITVGVMSRDQSVQEQFPPHCAPPGSTVTQLVLVYILDGAHLHIVPEQINCHLLLRSCSNNLLHVPAQRNIVC